MSRIEKPSAPKERKYKFEFKQQDKRYLIASLVLHCLVIAALLVSWDFSESVKIPKVPQSIQARVLSADELEQLNAPKKAEELAKQKKIQEAKKKKEQEIRRKKQEEKKRKEKAKAKAKAKEEARKKALIQKKEQERKAKEKALKEKADREKKAKEEARKKELAKQAQEKKEQERKQKELQKKEREQRMAERMEALDAKAREATRKQNELELQERLSAQNKLAAARELEEQEKFMALIRAKIENRWHIPPKVRNKSLSVRLRLLPTGELSSATLIEKSGSAALDQSALNAIQSVRKFPVPDDKKIFEKYFRQFTMRFTPQDEE